jgi:hypothetical protein
MDLIENGKIKGKNRQQCDLINPLTQIMGRYTDRQQNDLISLISLKIKGDTQADG